MIQLQSGLPVNPQDYIPAIISAVTTVVLFVVVFTLVYLLGKYFVTRALKDGLKRQGLDRRLITLTVSTAVVTTAVVAVSVAATVAGFGVVLGAFATLAGALSLAVGFAAQDLISNFVAGVFILHDEPFTLGDWIEWDDNTGIVREIQLRVTKVETFDNELLTVPNSHLANAAVTNPVANDRLRVTNDFGIGYGDDIKQAREAIVDEGMQIDGVLDDPAPSAPVKELGGSAVVLSGRVWIDPNESDYRPVRAQFVEAVKERFDAEGIDMPYATTEITGDFEIQNLGEAQKITTN